MYQTKLEKLKEHFIFIRESLYYINRFVLGEDAMRKLALTHVFISGMGGLGIEIAKNVILGGVKAVTIHDVVDCHMSDLSAQVWH